MLWFAVAGPHQPARTTAPVLGKPMVRPPVVSCSLVHTHLCVMVCVCRRLLPCACARAATNHPVRAEGDRRRPRTVLYGRGAACRGGDG